MTGCRDVGRKIAPKWHVTHHEVQVYPYPTQSAGGTRHPYETHQVMNLAHVEAAKGNMEQGLTVRPQASTYSDAQQLQSAKSSQKKEKKKKSLPRVFRVRLKTPMKHVNQKKRHTTARKSRQKTAGIQYTTHINGCGTGTCAYFVDQYQGIQDPLLTKK